MPLASGPRDELRQRLTALQTAWQRVQPAAGLDPLLEFAVAVSSLTDYLHNQGLAGLHHLVRLLEQQTLNLLDANGQAAATPAQQAAIDARLQELALRVADYVDHAQRPAPERRVSAALASAPRPRQRVWLFGCAGAAWQELVLQLGCFNIDAEFHQLRHLPPHGEEPTIALLNAAGQDVDQICDQIAALRQRFSASQLIVQGCPDDFESLRAALAAGADHCLSADGSPATLMGRLIELCDDSIEDPWRALVVEDSRTASQAITRTLAMIGVQCRVVDRPALVLEQLAQFQPDLILMDMSLPGCTGIEAARVIRQHREFLSVPIVYLSGDTNVPMQVEALRLGGDQFLTKPYNPVILNAVVQSKIERYRALRRAIERDSLTGLYTHGRIKDRLGLALEQARAAAEPLSAAMLDIDHFKQINDRHGHPMGDQVIRNMGWFLRQQLRRTDLIGRYGGEEFLVVLRGATREQALALLQRIRADFAQVRHLHDAASCTATLSGGVAELRANDDVTSLINRADTALYQAKHAGRDRIVAADAPAG
jgi:diguanylate cyclase (GGDEF)-like protein